MLSVTYSSPATYLSQYWSADSISPCADPTDAARRRTIIIACTVAAGTALLTAAAALLVWRLRAGKQQQGIKVSQSTIRQLSASSAVDLTFELDKNKSPILLGKGAFGEVSLYLL